MGYHSFMIVYILDQLIEVYSWLIIISALMSWVPIMSRSQNSLLSDIAEVLHKITEPYLQLFRKFMPSLGGVDFSPVIALLVLQIVKDLILKVYN